MDRAGELQTRVAAEHENRRLYSGIPRFLRRGDLGASVRKNARTPRARARLEVLEFVGKMAVPNPNYRAATLQTRPGYSFFVTKVSSHLTFGNESCRRRRQC